MPDTYVTVPKTRVQEGGSFSATAYFRTGNAAATPTTAQYRIDCLTSGKEVRGWTDLSVSTSNSITVTSTDNAIQNPGNEWEKKQITVQADQGTDTQTRDVHYWNVFNNRAF